MSFLSSVVSLGKAALDRIASGTSDPNLVKAVSPSELASAPIQGREGPIVFYGPRTVGRGKAQEVIFEVVVHTEKATSYR